METRFTEQPAAAPTCHGCGTHHAPRSADCPLSRVGATIAGRYRLDRLLGAGGMGSVYEAENLQLGRRVALKLLHPGLAARPDVVDRFRREARNVANLTHRGFAQVFALDVDERGQFYIEMELLVGEGVDRIARPVPIAQCIAIIESTLEALTVAHAAGLVHRDLKPENLFLCGDHVKILDFGIARQSTDDRLTSIGQFMGTIAFASPEQLRDASSADARSDIYSLGGTAFYLITGELACGGGNYADTITRIMTSNIERSVRVRRPDAPKWLDAAIARALDGDPARRYAHAAEMLDEVRAGKRTSSALAFSPTTPDLAARPRSKLPWLVLGGGVVIAGAIGVGVVMSRSEEPASSPVAAPVARAEVDAAVPLSVDAAVLVPVPADAAVAIAVEKPKPKPETKPERKPETKPERKPETKPEVKPEPTPPQPPQAPPATTTPAGNAEQLNQQGKDAMYKNDYATALEHFEAAGRAAPTEPRYQFNIATAAFQVGNFVRARQAAKRTLALGPAAELRQKTLSLLERIDAEAKAQQTPGR